MLDRFITHFCLVVHGATVLEAEGAVGFVEGAVIGALSAKGGTAVTGEVLSLLELLEHLCVELGGVHPKECYHRNYCHCQSYTSIQWFL